MWVVEAHSESETDLRGRSFTSGDIEIISGLEIIRGCASSSRGIFRKFWANNSIFGKILYLTSKLNISPFTIWVGGYYWDSPNIMFILKDPSRVERLVIRCSSEAWNYKTRLPLTRQLCPGTVLINDRNIKNRARETPDGVEGITVGKIIHITSWILWDWGSNLTFPSSTMFHLLEVSWEEGGPARVTAHSTIFIINKISALEIIKCFLPTETSDFVS